jgi:pimeloyl-ACP methyl ester carboxylesterase
MEWLLVVAVILVGVPTIAWLAQDSLIFFPQPVASTAHLPPRASPFAVTAADGATLRGWIAHGATNRAPAVVYFGGNAEEVSWTLADTRWPPEWTIVAVNYRGYGESEGKPGWPALQSDGLAIFDAVAGTNGIDKRRIVVVGRSLGTAVATHVAALRPIAGAVLVSPYDSLAAVGRHHYPWLPVSLLLRHRFEPARDAGDCDAALLSIVAVGDAIMPVERSRALFDAWAGPKQWFEVPNADHNTLGATSEYWRRIAAFLAAIPPP